MFSLNAFRYREKNLYFAIMKLSIIIPVYNTEQTLEKCIDSVLQSSLNNFEIILVNDGSTDNSANICESYKNSYPRTSFRLFIKKIKDFSAREMQD